MVARKDITNQKFGRLTALRIDNSKRSKTCTGLYWLCQCDCGNTSIVDGTSLRNGSIKSCGCLKNELASKRFRTHGYGNSKLNMVWQSMKQRCYNPKNKDYKNYGGRNIRVDDRWKESFEEFHDWAITCGYREGLSIDRIDVNGNYDPSNCRWVNAKIQANNQRRNRIVIYRGESHTISEWSDITGISSSTLESRINNYHWSDARALETRPVKGRNQYGC